MHIVIIGGDYIGAGSIIRWTLEREWGNNINNRVTGGWESNQ